MVDPGDQAHIIDAPLIPNPACGRDDVAVGGLVLTAVRPAELRRRGGGRTANPCSHLAAARPAVDLTREVHRHDIDAPLILIPPVLKRVVPVAVGSPRAEVSRIPVEAAVVLDHAGVPRKQLMEPHAPPLE
jgi:hypothetical protein